MSRPAPVALGRVPWGDGQQEASVIAMAVVTFVCVRHLQQRPK